MTAGTFTQELTKSLTDQARGIAHLRRIRLPEAWDAIAATCRDNAELSAGDSEALAYWRSALAVCERQRADESDPRWKS